MTYKDFLKTKIDAVVEVKNKKRAIQNQLNEISDKLTALDLERQHLRKNLHKDHQQPDKIQQEVENMQKRFETTTLKNPQEEKKILADIKFLKASLPSAEKLLELKPQIDALYDKRKGLKEEIGVLKEDIEGKEKEIEGVRKEIEDAKELRQDVKQQLDKYEEEITKIKEDLQKLYT